MHYKCKMTSITENEQEKNQLIMHSPCEDGDEPQSPIFSKYLLQVFAYADIEAISVWPIDKSRSGEGL